MTFPPRRSLFSRVFLHGLLVLGVSAVTFVGLAALLVRPAIDRHLLEFGRWIAPHVCAQLLADDHGAALPSRSIASAYDVEGRLLATTADPPVAPLSPAGLAELRRAGLVDLAGAPPRHAFWCGHDDRAYVVMGPPPPPLSWAMLLPTAVVLLVVALASVPFARSIARPLAQLVGVTQAFGKGDLGVRIDLPRRDEVGELASAFNQMAGRLQRVIRAEQELLANVSHELRTPLARMRVVLETAQENPRRAEAMLQEIGRDLHDLERLVSAVTETMRLGMANVDMPAHQLPARREALDLTVCLHGAAARFRALYPDRTLDIELGSEPLPAHADPRLLQRLLDNLLDNARKYAAAPSPIVLRARRQGADCVVEVIDRGLGIDASDLPHVLEPFFRGERGRDHAVPGSGLGLALVKRIVDLHDGALTLTSEPGEGTTVRVTLPARSA
ncbi:MAG: HAMP domain-containing sensor histidine kinase [Polyangiales bacterium]